MCKKKVIMLLMSIMLLTVGCGGASDDANGNQGNTGSNGTNTSQMESTEGTKNTEETEVTESTENTEVKEGYVDISQYDNVSSTYGGVFIIEKDGLKGLMDKNGRVLCEPKYNGNYWWAPNESGYSVVSDNENYYVLNKEGKEVFKWTEPVTDINVTEDNIICVNQDWDCTEDEVAKVSYWKIDGTKIGEFKGCTGYPFNDGVAVIVNEDGTRFLSKDGSLENAIHYDWGTSAYSEGYYFAYDPEGYNLIERATGKSGPCFWGDMYAMEVTDFTVIESAMFGDYYKNGVQIFHYMGYGVQEVSDGQKEKAILVNYLNADANYELSTPIAVYDHIQMDNFKYLYACDGEKVFYIDYSGKVVSDIFISGTEFNNDGYIMVMQEEGTVRLCNDRFETIKTFENVTEFKGRGDAFYLQQNGKIYLYFPN